MHCGALADFNDIIEMLIQFDFQAESLKYNTTVYECLETAIREYKWDFVRALLSAFLDPIKVVATTLTEDRSSKSFLHVIERADTDLVKLFVEHGICKPDLLSLKSAIDRNSHELVQYLLESKNQLSVMDEYKKYSGYSCLLSYIFSSLEYKSQYKWEQNFVKLIADYGADSRDIDGNTVVHLACKYSVKFIIENNNYDHNVMNNEGQVPLHIACEHGNLEIIKLVSSQPTLDINLQDLSEAGNTPLHIACKSESRPWRRGDVLPCFRYLLLEKHCSISIQNNLKELPFHILLNNYSVTEDDTQSIIAMCNKEELHNIINAQNSDGMTMLHLACKNSAVSIVHFLTSNFQCDVNLLDGNGNLPLHYAVDHGLYKLVEMVIDDSTPIHAKNSSGFTPLQIACENSNVDVVKYLVFHKNHPLTISPGSNVYDNLDIHLACQNNDDIDLLKVMANHKNINRIKHLTIQEIDFRLYYDYHGAPIHLACKCSNIPAIRLLGELKCDFSLKDSRDMLPLHIVCSEMRSLECIKLLKIHSNDLKSVDRDGNTPLHLACKHGCADIVQYLTTYGCDFNIKNKQKELPLHLACSTTLEVVQRVLSQSLCNINCQTETGYTPLHIACSAGALDIVKYLVHNCECHPSMTMRNASGRLPVHYACEHSLEIVKLVAEPCTVQDLLSKDIYDIDYLHSMTPLDIACSHGLLDVTAYLINDKGCSLSMLQGDQSALGYASGVLKPNVATPYLDLVKFLIDKCGYDPWKSIGDGYNNIAPIFEHVCRMNNLELLEALTIHSEDIKDSEGNTPLHYACKYSRVEIVQFLVNHGCDQTILNNKGELALHIACCRSLTITQMLTNCDVNTLDLEGNAPIHISIAHSDDIVTFLMKEAKCDINIPNGSGRYALHIACSRSLRTTNLLLQNLMLDVNCQDADGNTALNIVCTMGLDDTIEILLENQLCRADIPNKSGDFPLHSYLKQTRIDNFELQTKFLPSKKLHVIEIILARFSKAATMANQEGITPSQIAVIKGITEFLQLLHRRNEFHFSNKTLLHVACRYRQVHIVRWLLDHGAESTIPDEDGNYPQHLCIDDNNHELKLKIEAKYREALWEMDKFRGTEPGDAKKVPAHLYIGADNPSLKTLIELGTLDVYRQNMDGNTILHIACQDDRDHILLQHILANFEHERAFLLANNNRDTPLHILAARKMTLSNEILALVKCHNCPGPTLKNKLGNTPLHIACQSDNTEFAKLLLEIFPCDTDTENDQGEVPLHIAASKSLELIKLVATTENINAQRNDGDTPLHVACQHEELDIVMHLIDSLKCSVQILNDNEDTPFHIILQSKKLGQITSLLKCIPSSESARRNKIGDTLLHLACRYSTASTVSFLVKSLRCKTDTLNENSGAAPLHFACGRNSISIVEAVSNNCNANLQLKDVSLLRDPNDVDRFISGDTPLHVACRAGWINITEHLLEVGHAGALCIRNCQGDLPLHLACQHNDKMIRLFIKYAPMFDCNTVNLAGDTPLHIICRNKPTAASIKVLVHLMKLKINVANGDGDLPLHIACRHAKASQGTLNILCTGLSQEELNIQNINGNTVLHELLKRTILYDVSKNEYYIKPHEKRNRRKKQLKNAKEAIKYIIQRMSTVAIPNHDGEHPIHLACQYQIVQIVKFLYEKYHASSEKLPEGILHYACLNEDPNVLGYLAKKLELDHDADVPDKSGDLPLHIAVRQRSVKGVELLIKKTLNVNHPNHRGNTPVHEFYNDDVAPSSTVITRVSELSSLLNATSQISKYLMENPNVSFSIRNSRGQTPLHCMAARYSDLEELFARKKLDNSINCQDNEGRTPLHIACQANRLKCVELLLSAGADVSVKDMQGQTAITLTKEPGILKVLIEHGADPQPVYDAHRQYFEAHSSETPPPTPAKLIVIGDPSMGKTTLVQSLRNEGSEGVISADNFDHTAGIVTTAFSSKIYGDVKFFDFAGQPEYYASHDGFLYSILKNIPPIILLLVKITDTKRKIQNRIHYWINFIENRCAVIDDATHIIIVCSHADVLESQGGNPLTKVSELQQSILSEFDDKILVLKGIIHINCKLSYSEEIVKLQQILRESTNELHNEGVMHINLHCFYLLLLQIFKDCKVITLGHIVSKLKVMSKDSDKSPLFLASSDRSAVIQMCKDLDDKGHIMFIEHPSIPDKSWLIHDSHDQPLLHELVGTIFAPSSFPQHRPLSYSTGVVPLSRFEKYLDENYSYPPNMMLTFLTKLEYCREITDKVLLESIVKQEGYSETERYYFFPNLVSRDRPDDKWSTTSKYSYQCGWLIQCKKEGDFFSPHFIQALLLRLTFAFAPKKVAYDSKDIEDSEDESEEEENQAMALVIKRTCSVWKNGLYWQQSGMKTIVDIIDQRTLVLLMQCHRGRELQLLMCRSMIMSMVLDAKNEFSSKSQIMEYFLHPECVKHPLESISKCRRHLFSLPKIECSIRDRDPCVTNDYDEIDLQELLLFEPYFELSTDILKKLSDEANFHETANNDLLSLIARDIDRKHYSFFVSFSRTLVQQLVNILKHNIILTRRKRSSGATRQDLHEFFHQMSIFYGRHPPQGIQ
jgi:ankyrin repeat protein